MTKIKFLRPTVQYVSMYLEVDLIFSLFQQFFRDKIMLTFKFFLKQKMSFCFVIF